MEWSHSQVGAVDVMVVRGRLDTEASLTFGEVLVGVATRSSGRVLLDLAGVDYLVSETLRSFLQAARHLRPAGGKLVLANVQPLVRQVLEIAGFCRLFQVYSSATHALEDLSRPVPVLQP